MASYATGTNVWPEHSAFISRALHRKTLRLVQFAPPVTGNNITTIYGVKSNTNADAAFTAAKISHFNSFSFTPTDEFI